MKRGGNIIVNYLLRSKVDLINYLLRVILNSAVEPSPAKT
jgi:hypothetical protein